MADESWVDGAVGRELTADLVVRVRKQYQVSEDMAESIVLDLLRVERSLGAAVQGGQTLKQLQRMKAFKDLVSKARKNAYYALRKYDRTTPEATNALAELDALNPGEPIRDGILTALAKGHVSTAERLDGLDGFHAELFARIGEPETIVDVGCGIYPVLFPFAKKQVQTYVALDKDPQSVDILERYARARGDERLVPMRFNLADGWAPVVERTGVARFDVALVFKVVPVVKRRDRLALDVLVATPADLLVLTGSAKSMTKHADISRRERATLLSFAEEAGLDVVDDFLTDDETVVIARRQSVT